jgi:hypothetical protein
MSLNSGSNADYIITKNRDADEGPLRLGVCLINPSLRGERGAGRCEAAGSKKPEAYSLEYVEDFFGPRTTQMPADRLPQ